MAKTTTATNQRDRAQDQAPPREAPRGNVPANNQRIHPLVAFKDYADQRMASLETALPPHITQNAFMSVVLTALQKKPDLLKCTRQSLWNACIDAANCGLLPDGIEGAIAPYGVNENGQRKAEVATFMPMIGGYRKLAYEGGLISSWEVNLVRQRDDFVFALGDDAFIEHRPYFGADDPGAVVGAYSIAKLKDGAILRDVMGLFELNKIKMKSKALKNGPWADPTFEPEMHRKTMGRRHYKQLPKTPALSRLIDRENATFDLDANAADQIDERRQRRIGTVGAAFDAFAGGPVIENHAEDDWDNGAADTSGAADDAGDHRDDDPPADTRNSGKRGATASDARADSAPGKSRVRNDAGQPDQQQRQQAKQQPAQQADEADDQGADDDSAGDDAADDATDGGEVTSGEENTDGSDDMTDRRWPRGEVPSDPDEYESYVETYLEDCDKSADIKPWFTSEAEKTLRTKCNVGQPLYKALQTKASHRMTALKEQGK